jgi:Ser/Thr protein kinase RdoA (MazF antagonist)
MILEAELDLDLLRSILRDEYNLVPKVLDRSTWSHSTVNYYIELESGERYIAKINPLSEERFSSLQKDIYFSNLLKDELPSQHYLRSNSGQYILKLHDRLIRVAEFISGVPPFDMNMDVFEQIIGYLKVIHAFPVSMIEMEIPQILPEVTDNRRFLHGDLTEANVLIADNKIIAVIDFEFASIGPIEWDISKSIVFCWGRMLEVEPQVVFNKALEVYSQEPSRELTKKLCLGHIETRLENNEKNREKYPNQEEWKQENEYYKGMLGRMEQITF